MTRARTLALGGTVSILALLLSACTAPSESSSTPQAGGTLVYASGDAEPSCLDPHVGGNYPQALISTQYLESLVSKSSDGEILPWLASEWTSSEDGLTWDFTIRNDVDFTDGTPLDAEAVKVNIEHLKDPETASSTGYLAVSKIAEMEVVDETTLRLHLSAPDSALLDSLSQPWVAIQSPTALERSQEENCESPVGTGPFIVTGWTKQQSVTLERNEDYTSPPADADHEGTAWLDGIEWRFIPDSSTRYAALQSGDVDVIDNAQPDRIAEALDGSIIAEINAPRPGASNRIELNSGKAPFDDERVREAFIRAADVNDGINSLYFGTAARSYSVLSSVETDSVSYPEYFDTDVDEANTLLDAAGWTERDDDGYRVKDGVRLSLDFPVSTNQSVPAEQALFEQIQANAAGVGFEVRLGPTDLSSWYSALFANDYNLVSAPYTKVGADVLRTLYHSDSIVPAPSGYYANLAQLSDPTLDTLLTQASEESDATLRHELYERAQEIIVGGYYVLPLYDQQNHFLHRTEVQGIRALPTVNAPTFFDAWMG